MADVAATMPSPRRAAYDSTASMTSSFPLRVGVLILPEHPWRESCARWQRAEEFGFAHAWTYDHLTWRGHRDLPWFSAIPTLTAAALATDRIRLGTLAPSPNFPNPPPLAKEIVPLAQLPAPAHAREGDRLAGRHLGWSPGAWHRTGKHGVGRDHDGRRAKVA